MDLGVWIAGGHCHNHSCCQSCPVLPFHLQVSLLPVCLLPSCFPLPFFAFPVVHAAVALLAAAVHEELPLQQLQCGIVITRLAVLSHGKLTVGMKVIACSYSGKHFTATCNVQRRHHVHACAYAQEAAPLEIACQCTGITVTTSNRCIL